MDQNNENRKTKDISVQAILSPPPIWIIRRGTLAIIFILILVIIGGLFIRYPETISIPITIVRKPPSIIVKAEFDGEINELIPKDSINILKGQKLATIEDAATSRFFSNIKKTIEKIKKAKSLKELHSIKFDSVTYLLAYQKDFFLTLKESFKNYNSVFLNNKLNENQKLCYTKTIAEDINKQVLSLERKKTVRAPTNGLIHFFKKIENGQHLTKDESIFLVTPILQQIESVVKVSSQDGQKLKEGQKVLIKIREYPHEKFGIINTLVEKIEATDADNSYYLLQIKIPDHLYTSRNKELIVESELTGVADIIVNEKSIFHKMFNNIYTKF